MRFVIILVCLFTLSACKTELAKHEKPLPYSLVAKIEKLNMAKQSPVLVRIFKEESELEVWKMARDGTYAHLKTYEICKWSGDLGPKFREGDRQAPEGFYTIHPHQMNPNSSYHLAFNLGYPNDYDQAHGRTGSFLMVHGACSSRGCYAMEDDQIEEIYALGREAFYGGQRAFQVQAYPFRMTPANLARHANSPHFPFWMMLKEGHDHFMVTRKTPKIDVCNKRYVFNAKSYMSFNPNAACPDYQIDPTIMAAVKAKQDKDNAAFNIALATLQAEKMTAIASEQPKKTEKEDLSGDTPLFGPVSETLRNTLGLKPKSETDPILTGSLPGEINTSNIAENKSAQTAQKRGDEPPVTEKKSMVQKVLNWF
jgi:murein L,D-transpeptidase YafK